MGRRRGGGGPGHWGGWALGLTGLFLFLIPGLGAGPPRSSSLLKKLPESNSSARSGGQGCALPYLEAGLLSFLLSLFQSSQSWFRTFWGAPSSLPYSGPLSGLSPPLASVTWAGFPLPRPRATFPCTRLALGPGVGAELSGHSSYRYGGVGTGERGVLVPQRGVKSQIARRASRDSYFWGL